MTQAIKDALLAAVNVLVNLINALPVDGVVTPPVVVPPVVVPPVVTPPAAAIQLSPKPARLPNETNTDYAKRVAPYTANIIAVGKALKDPRAKAALIAAHSNLVTANDNPIMSLYDFNTARAGNAPGYWDDKTMAYYAVDGTVVEAYVQR